MSWRNHWQHIGERRWTAIENAILASMPSLPEEVTRPDPGVENLPGMQYLRDFRGNEVLPDIEGLRSNLLLEAIFLFQKCGHTQFAGSRLSTAGMNSWALFNGYHSALLGAKGLMALLGVGFPMISGAQLLIDMYPAPPRPSQRAARIVSDYSSFKCVRLSGKMDQRYVWEAFQRTLRQAKDAWTNQPLLKEIDDLDWEDISKPRNKFLYKSHYWTEIEDIGVDQDIGNWQGFLGDRLDVDAPGFLIHLSMAIHDLFKSKLDDLAALSNGVAAQLAISRWPQDPSPICYEEYRRLRTPVEAA